MSTLLNHATSNCTLPDRTALKRPTWTSPWKKLPLRLQSSIPSFPLSDLRHETHRRSQQESSPPPIAYTATVLNYYDQDAPFAEPLHTPVAAPDEFVKGLWEEEKDQKMLVEQVLKMLLERAEMSRKRVGRQ